VALAAELAELGEPSEPGVWTALAEVLSDGDQVLTASSMPVRDVEYFWPATTRRYRFFFNRGANRVDLEAFSFLYPLADATLIRKMEGSEITLERLEHVMKALGAARIEEQVVCSFIGLTPREDLIAYTADFFLQIEDVKWTIIAGVVNEMLVMSVRNLGYSRNAGEFVRKWFADIGSAGGHRAMAKAVVPLAAFRAKFGVSEGREFTDKISDLAVQFLREHQATERKREPAVRA